MVDKNEYLALSSITSSKGIQSPEDRHQLNNRVLIPRPLSVFEPQQRHSLLKQVKIGQQHQSMEWTPIMRRPYNASTSSNSLARHSMSSFSLHFSKFASLYQPQLENYHHDNLSQKQIDRLSIQYSSSDTIQQLLQYTPSLASTLSSLSSSSSSSTTTSQSNDLSSCVVMDDLNGTISSSSSKNQQAHPLPISPPMSSPNSSVRLSTSSATSFPTPRTSTLISSPSSKPILPEEDFYYPLITHIQKHPKMRLRSFLCQSVLLDKTIRLEQHTLSIDSRFFGGNDEQTGQAKAILKLSLVKLSSKHVDHSMMAPFGISFINLAKNAPGRRNNGGGLTGNMNLYATIPDSLVLEALNVWLSHSQLPRLSHASHIMRTGIKLHIVFDIPMIE